MRRTRTPAQEELRGARTRDEQARDDGHEDHGPARTCPAFDSPSHTPRILVKSRPIARSLDLPMHQPFNPTHSVRFELGRGRVSIDGTEARLLVPADALLDLCKGAGRDSAKDFGRRLGTEMGRRVAARLDGTSSVAAIVEHLGGELALAGLGSLGVEVWGRALVFTVNDSPLGGDGDALLSAVLEGALQRALSRDASVVPIARTDGKARLAVVSPLPRRPLSRRGQRTGSPGAMRSHV